MDLSRIEKLLKSGSDVDLQALYVQFRATSDTGDLDLAVTLSLRSACHLAALTDRPLR